MSWSDVAADLRQTWHRHNRSGRDFGFWSIANYRVGRATGASDNAVVRVVGSKLYGLCSVALNVMAGMQVNREATIGAELRLVHGWNVKIHPAAVIGDRVGIMHDVTIGTTPESDGVATIGNDVFIGAGARILGPVRIGDRVRIAANSLVITDVPAGGTAVGVPARVLFYTGRADAPSTPPVAAPKPPPQPVMTTTTTADAEISAEAAAAE
ncbi:MAG: serine acetyltransferase [Deltaproteobacteria bacterium]|nr:serine acetyltransferase [Deltaproteobacteria bacterium]